MAEMDTQFSGVVPRPVRMERGGGSFSFDRDTRFVVHADDDRTRRAVERFVDRLNSALWRSFSVEDGSSIAPDRSDCVHFLLDPDLNDVERADGYQLHVTPDRVSLRAPGPQGLFYGCQTLRQLLPPAVEHSDPSLVPRDVEWAVPAVEISDVPRFSYRGLHLDVARHRFPVSFIKKYIDLMALYKFNRFHWHLTDDQGWRLELDRYPELTETGAWRSETQVGTSDRGDGQRYGGFYTKEEVREVVSYARERHVQVIPEIDIPGHCSAVLAAYPELGCDPDRAYHVETSWGVKENVLAPREETFAFLDEVLEEVLELFPGTYVHLGGDEAPTTHWANCDAAKRVMKEEGMDDVSEVHHYFMERMEARVEERGRRMIGWDETLEAGRSDRGVLMSWRGMKQGVSAARRGLDVVMTPHSDCYFDYDQADPKHEPLGREGTTTVRDVYAFEPVPDELDEAAAERVIGTQGCAWTEFMKTGSKVEYMVYPRAIALAEVAWTAPERREWEGFWRRLQAHFERLDVLGVNAAGHYDGELEPFSG